MNTLGYICDWGLRRLFKLFLKRHLSNLLATEVDVEQLSVQLETGSLELKECLLDVEYLNESFLKDHPVKVDSALIGSLRATLYPPTISLEDIALDISLQSIPKTECKKKFGEGSHLNDSTFASPSNEKQAEFSRGSALEEGVQLISQRLKSLIHQVQLDLKSCIVRGRSHDGCLFLANLGSLLVEDDRNEDSLGESQLFFARTCLFQNLILQYCKEDSQSQPFTILSSTRGGCNGQLRFSWNNSEESRQIELDLAILNDINLWIDYPAIYAVRNAVQHFTAGYHRRANEDLPSMRQSTHLSQPDRAKSILEALMLPNGEQILNEKLQSSNAGMANYIETDEVEEFFDAVSDQMSQSWASAASVLVSSFMTESQPKDRDANDTIAEIQNSFAFNCELPNFSVFVDLEGTALADPLILRFEIEMVTVSRAAQKLCLWLVILAQGTRHVAFACNRLEACELGITISASEIRRSLQQCVTISSLFDLNAPLLFSKRSALSSTINRLYHLRLGTSVQAKEYEIMPLLAVTHSEAEVAVSVNYFPEHVAGTPKLDLLVCSAHVWLDQQILERTINHFQRLKKLFDSASGSTTNRFFSFVSSISSVGVYFFPSNTKDVVSLRLEGEEGGSVQSRFQKGIETSDPEPFLDIVQNHEKVLAHLNPTSLELFYCVCSGLNMESYTAHRCVWGYDLSIISTINDSFGDVTNPSKRCNHDYALVIDGTRIIELDAWTVGYETSISIDINGCLSLSFSESSAISTLQSGGKSQELQRGRPWTVEARVREVALHFCPTTDESPYILSVTNLVLRQQKNDSWESFLTLYGRNWNLTYEDERNRLVSGGSLNGISVDEDYSFTFNKRVSWNNLDSAEYELCMKDLYFSDDWQKFECLITYFKGLRGNSQPSNKAQGYTFRFGASNVLVLYSPGMENLPRFGFVVGHFSLTSEKDRITIISNELGVFMKSVGDGVSYPSSKNFIEWLLSENFARVLFEESLELSYVPDLPTSVSSKACIAEITRETVLNLYAVADAWHGTAFFQNKNTNDTNTFNLATNAGDEDHLSSAKPVNISHGDLKVKADKECYTKNRAVVSGDGAWIPDVARLADVLESENRHISVSTEDEWLQGYRLNWTGLDANLWQQKYCIFVAKVTVILTGTTSFAGMEMLEGAVEAVLSDASIMVLDGLSDSTERYVASVGRCNVRHCVQPQRLASMPWQDVMNTPSRGEQFTAVRSIVEVSCGSQKSELSVRLSLAPMKIVFHFFWVVFVSNLLSGGANDPWEIVEESSCSDEDDWNIISSMMPIKVCHFFGFPCDLYFKRNSLSIGALKSGSLLELLNVLPEWKANLWLREMKIHEAEDVFRLGMITAAGWIEDIIKAQMNRMLIRLPAVASFRRLSSAARDMLQSPQNGGRKELKAYLRRAVSYLVQTLSDESATIRSR